MKVPRNDLRAILALVQRGELSSSTAHGVLRALAGVASPTPAAAPGSAPSDVRQASDATDIAVIGWSARVPGAADVPAFWENLRQGRQAFERQTRETWDVAGHPFPVGERREWAKPLHAAFLRDIDQFDPLFFRIPPQHAVWMDPRQRLFLEECWKSIEDAGYSAAALRGQNCGVFVGCEGGGDYYAEQFGPPVPCPEYFLGSSNSILASRIAYFADLQGPAVTIDTGCSSSLVAIHLACENLRNGSCDLALAGGIQLITSLRFFALLEQLGVLSPTGHQRCFGAGADGFTPGEAVGVLLLERLDRALANGDPVHGVIKASGINQDGRSSSITAPSPLAQTRLAQQVYRRFGIAASSIGLVEAHGTGTALGDPIEFEALTATFENGGAAAGSCALGSVKSNVGHTGAAAGVIGVIKALACVQHGEIPPLAGFVTANPALALDRSPFFINRELMAWPGGTGRRAAVSSFGHSGTNAHLVVEAAPAVRRTSRGDRPELFLISGKTPAALARNLERLGARLEAWRPADGTLSDIAHTLHAGRTPHPFRRAVVAESLDELRRGLDAAATSLAAAEPAAGVPVSIERVAEPSELPLHGLDEAPALRRRRLQRLGQLFAAGGDVAVAAAHGDAPRSKLRLPPYSFEHERYWLSGAPAAASVAAPEPALAPLRNDLRLLEKRWRVLERGAARPLETATPWLVLVSARQRALAEEAIRQHGADGLFIEVHANGPAPVAGADRFDIESARSGAELVQRLGARLGVISTVIDLSSLDAGPERELTPELGKLVLLQAIVRERARTGLTVLHLTAGLQAFSAAPRRLSGAVSAALVRCLGAEYRRVRACSVDLEQPPPDAPQLARLLAELLALDSEASELCWRGGRVYAPVWEAADDMSREPARELPTGVWLVTGASGGVGAALARHCAARGVRRMALLAHRSLPPRERWRAVLEDPAQEPELRERVRRLQDLVDAGVELLVHTGPLSDLDALRGFLARVRDAWGPIAAVIHAAGAAPVDAPAFIDKPIEGIGRVLEPKTSGLSNLWSELEADRPKLLALCSSISAAVPALATGQLEYAAASGALEFFALHVAARSTTEVRAWCWPLWQGVGLGKHGASALYTQLGFEPLPAGDALASFDRSLAVAAPVLSLPCCVSPTRFSPAHLSAPRPRATPEETDRSFSVTPQLAPSTPPAPDPDRLRDTLERLRQFLSTELRIPLVRLAEDTHFEEFGVDSIVLAGLVGKLEQAFGCRLNPSLVLEYPSTRKLAEQLVSLARVTGETPSAAAPHPPAAAALPRSHRASAEPEPEPGTSLAGDTLGSAIAIVGMACRFPMAANRHEFWANLVAGRDCISEVPASRWDHTRLYSPEPRYGRSLGKWGGYLQDIECFDAAYFKIRAELAPQLDPAIRLFLEQSVQVLRDGGYAESELSGRAVGVFVGARMGSYSQRVGRVLPDSIVGSGQNFVAAHVSHFLNLSGPSLVIDSACSSSLVSVAMACQNLAAGSCEMAIAGGVDVLLDEKMHLGLSEAKALSPDGRCHTFGADANGMVPGEGCGAVLLKPLAAALRDGDRVLAVIEGAAINNDGRTMGMTTPKPEAQRAVIEAALRAAKISVPALSYVEAHGTGTLIGDPIELRALNHVFAAATAETGFCGIGSVKSNIGHLLSAAGIASLIKVAACLHAKQLVPTLHCAEPNPRFEFERSAFYPVRQLQPWAPRHGRRVAGISSFGFGGTNAHLILSDRGADHVPARAPLPAVVFDAKRHWLDPVPVAPSAAPEPADEARPKLQNGLGNHPHERRGLLQFR